MDQLLTTSSESANPKFYRVLNDVERSVIGPDAFGYIIKMVELGLLSFEETESLIERAMMSDFAPISLEEMQYLTIGVMFENEFSTQKHVRLLNSSNQAH